MLKGWCAAEILIKRSKVSSKDPLSDRNVKLIKNTSKLTY